MSVGRDRPVVEAAGALVWRRRHGRLQVQLVHRPRYDDWSWPKGKLEPGETTATAAAREVAEETGRPVVLGVPLPGLRYRTSEGRPKRVHYWAARRAGDDDAPALRARRPVARASQSEVDDRAWLDVAAAAGRLTRADDRGPLEALLAADAAGRLDTHAIAVVRHGVALDRASWHGPDQDRPLTHVGSAQADAVVPVLAAYGARHVVSSRWERCAATVAPYARATGLEPTWNDGLSESPDGATPDGHASAGSAVGGLLGHARSSVLCTHRPVLPAVLAALGGHADPPVVLPAKDPYLEPGEILVAHVAAAGAPRVVAVERVRPPVR